MFQFGRFPYRSLGMTQFDPRRVSPFGYLRLLRSYTPHRSFSQYNTSFIGTRCLGIHCVPLLAFRTIVRSRRLSWHALIGITFALFIQLLRRTRYGIGQPHNIRSATIASRSVRQDRARCKTQIAERAPIFLRMSPNGLRQGPTQQFMTPEKSHVD